MSFTPASTSAFTELEERSRARDHKLKFGISFLDDAGGGISPRDLILIGAPSGVGKTELCCNIALANIQDGKRVHYIALEAEPFEIERRLKFQLVSKAYHMAPLEIKPKIKGPLTYDKWADGEFVEAMREIEDGVADLFSRGYKDLLLFYKQNEFTISDLIEKVSGFAHESDLIIVDHVHYFDFDDDNENRAVKKIAMTARTLALEEGKPIILVSHLRKRDKGNQELCAGLDEFHGSSELFKVATKVITVSPGGVTSDGKYETFMRVPKNRKSGNATRYLGRLLYSPKTNSYDQGYKLGWSTCSRSHGFEELDPDLYPAWTGGRS